MLSWTLLLAATHVAAAENGQTTTEVEMTGVPAAPAMASETPGQPEGVAPAEPLPAAVEGVAPAAAGLPVAPAGVPTEEVSYHLKLRAIEERVNDLKEKIFQSKARLLQLQEVVLQGTIAGAKAVLVHRNEMGSSFRLVRAQYALDGAPIFTRVDSGAGDLYEQEEIEVFSGSIAPGNHQVSVYLEYQGHGYGLFSYLQGYRFKLKSSYTFTAEEGRATTVRVVGYEKGGITTQLRDRPSVRYDVEVSRELRKQDVSTSGSELAPN